MQIKRIQRWIENNTSISILLSFLLVLIPFLRANNNMYKIMGDIAFFHENIIKNYILFIDDGKTNLYHAIMYTLSFIVRLDFLETWFPIILGILTAITIWFILKDEEQKKIYSIIFVLLLSPTFIYTFTHNTPYSLILFLYSLYIYLVKKKNILQYLLAIIIASQSLLDSLIILLIPYITNRKEKTNLIIVGIVNIFYIMLFQKIPQTFISNIEPSYIQNVGSLNGLIGLGLFIVLLSVVGIIKLGTIRKRYAVLTLLMLIIWQYSIYPHIILTLLAGYGLYRLIIQDWNLKELKTITIFMLICSFIFISLAYTNVIINESPSKSIVNSLNVIKTEFGKTYNNQNIGNLINSRTNTESICTPLECNEDIYYNITYSRDLKKTREILKNNSINYIIITEKDKTWKEKDDGLLFLLRDKNTFTKIVENKDIEIIKANVS